MKEYGDEAFDRALKSVMEEPGFLEKIIKKLIDEGKIKIEAE
jgi:hypothetical protein